MGFLDGYKSYIVGAGVALATFAYSMQWIDDAVYKTVLGFLGAGGIYTLRQGIKKAEKKGGE